jgi:type IV secretory pathway VirB2 component (pilin)
MTAMMPIDAKLRRRVLFVFGNLAVAVAVIAGVAMPIHDLFASRAARIQDQRRVLARLSAIAAQASNVEAVASDTTAQLQSGEFLTGANENVIGADLQTKLKSMTDAAGARSRAIQTLPGRTIDQIRYSGVRIDLTGSLPALMRAVYAIESTKPYLFVTAASLKSSPISRQGPAEEPVLQAQLDIYGATQIGGQP